jgi:hypothetical protein
MITRLLTEGDLDRGRPPARKSPHWRCSIVDPASGAVCTRRPGHDGQHKGYETVTGGSTRLTDWSGGTERAMVVDGYTWTRIPGTDFEVRALTERPLALRYRPRGISGPHPAPGSRPPERRRWMPPG